MAKVLLLAVVISFSFVACSPSHETVALGPSSSGGGNTSPTRANPKAVLETIQEVGAQALLTWLHAAENEYRLMDRNPQNLYAKLFGGTKTIYDVLAVTPVEVRFSEPCYDNEGLAHDGSIYAHAKGAICLSAFSMAHRLDDANVKQETLALVLHEMSHLVGTTEEEARAIQNSMLLDLNHIDLDAIVENIRSPLAEIGNIGWSIRNSIKSSEVAQDPYSSKFYETFDKIRYGGGLWVEKFLMISPDTENKIEAHICSSFNLSDYMCASDPKRTAEDRQGCQKEIDDTFLGAKEITARTYLDRRAPLGLSPNPEFDMLKVRRIESKSDLIANLQQEADFFDSIFGEMEALLDSKMAVVTLP